MPVISREEHKRIMKELRYRWDILVTRLETRELKYPGEGVKGRGHWVRPESKCATVADAMEIRLAVEDFKTILAEIKKLK